MTLPAPSRSSSSVEPIPARHRALMLLNEKAGEAMSTLQQVDGVKRQASDEAMAQENGHGPHSAR